MGSRGQSHGGAGMAGISFEGGIDLCNEDQISLTTSYIEPAQNQRVRDSCAQDFSSMTIQIEGGLSSQPKGGWC